jgi:uncharacterized protein YjbI with pentapeptide repeats
MVDRRWEFSGTERGKSNGRPHHLGVYSAVLRRMASISMRGKGSDLSEEIVVKDEFDSELLRYQVPEGRREFEGAVMEGAGLDGAVLEGVCFAKADLYWAGFFEANLRGADFTDAALQGADLTGADLTGACLRRANLGRDRLHGGTMLQGAIFTDADVEGAVFDGAEYNEATVFPDGFDPAAHGLVFSRE